ncbi:MAG: hypothetical protein JWP39_1064 [Jatrophihabitans sp.]|nr:hypothetical protein [Jatrophihabitans sp.]
MTQQADRVRAGPEPRRPLPFPRPRPPDESPSGTPVHAGPAAAHGQRDDRRPLPRWIAPFAVASLLGFLGWIVYLGFTLPAKVRAEHYDLAWLGYDCAMWSVLAAFAFCAIRRLAATAAIAAVASMMLLVDAWFDVFTSSGGDSEILVAIILALCGELPLAILCAWAAVHAERIRARAYHSLHLRWERAARAAEVAAEAAVELTRRKAAPRPQ